VEYTVNLTLISSDNVETWDVTINGDYYGSDLERIQLNTNDLLRVSITKIDEGEEATILYQGKLL
jgi:hypothetical protein